MFLFFQFSIIKLCVVVFKNSSAFPFACVLRFLALRFTVFGIFCLFFIWCGLLYFLCFEFWVDCGV